MSLFRKILSIFGENIFTKIMFVLKCNYIPDFNNPKSLNEKLNYIKLNRLQYDLRCMVADRILVREYVSKRTKDCELIPILYEGYELHESLWKKLPKKFVIKANHGSGMVLIIDKDKDDLLQIRQIIKKWQNTNYSKIGYEWYYEKLERKFIIEEYIEFQQSVPPDYKFFCFNGNVELVQVDLDRFKNHYRNLYDRNFQKINGELLYKSGNNIPKPHLFDKSIKIAEQLSKDFDFIRVDLYILENKIFFGELTNIPGNGMEKFNPKSLDFELGTKLRIMHEKN